MKIKKRSIEAVVFDLDGLLVDSEPVWFNVRKEMFGRFELEWTQDDQKALMGRSTQTWIQYIENKLDGGLSREEVESETLEQMVRRYRTGQVRVMPGADEALEFCSTRVALGLASGSPAILIDAALASNDWARYFDIVLSSDTVAQGKPSPDVYLEALKRLGIAPANGAVVEDSGSGILAGKAAGAMVIAVPNAELLPARTALDAADVVLNSLDELPETLEKSDLIPKVVRSAN